jgi:pimeloyl-ACP methyl ester carboxylesterase
MPKDALAGQVRIRERLLPFFAVPDAELWYEDSGGTGPVVVLLHPLTGNTESWEFHSKQFSNNGYRCISFDRRGWGRTRVSVDSRPVPASTDLSCLIDALCDEPFHLVASGAGAAVGLDYAQSFPNRLRSLVLSSGSCGIRDPDYLELQETIRTSEYRSATRDIRELSAEYRTLNPEGHSRWIEIESRSRRPDAPLTTYRNELTFAKLADLLVPTMLLAGTVDTQFKAMPEVAKRIPGASWATLPGASHAAFWEQPEAWGLLVLEFLSKN